KQPVAKRRKHNDAGGDSQSPSRDAWELDLRELFREIIERPREFCPSGGFPSDAFLGEVFRFGRLAEHRSAAWAQMKDFETFLAHQAGVLLVAGNAPTGTAAGTFHLDHGMGSSATASL